MMMFRHLPAIHVQRNTNPNPNPPRFVQTLVKLCSKRYQQFEAKKTQDLFTSTKAINMRALSLFALFSAGTVHSFVPSDRRGSQRLPPTAIFSSELPTANRQDPNVRFLGKGPNAIVRPGVVLVAPKNEFHHYYREAALFVYAMGEDEDYDNTYVIRCAILDMPTPFTLGEMAESTLLGEIKGNPMASNLIYRGGDKGGDHVFMLHNQESVGNGEMIGTSGIYQGGLQDALERCGHGDAKAEDFKFFFNFCQFTEIELESMLDSDPWVAVEVPSEYILNADWDRGDCWRQLRNSLQQEDKD